jgi:glycosyltransferase involved in cell wall biosynthesis
MYGSLVCTTNSRHDGGHAEMNQPQFTTSDPLVSAAIPLYRSRRFLDNITKNLESITYENIEIIVSDRHCADDTIDILRDRYCHDPRFKFIKRVDQIDWVAHYNTLLGQFLGKYFIWIPHDDIYPGDYIHKLVSCLEEHPDAVCAFGRYEKVDLAAAPDPLFFFKPPPISFEGNWTFHSAMKMFHWGGAKAFRGLFRRDVIVEFNFFIRPALDTFAADDCWIFGLSLMAPFYFVSECACKKRFFPTSTSARIHCGIWHWINHWFVLRSYLEDSCCSPVEQRLATVHILIRCSYRVFFDTLRIALPPFIKMPMKRLRYKIWSS